MSSKWQRLQALAEKVVERTMSDLPPEIAAEARRVPVLFQEWCEDDPEILGRYGYFEPGQVSDGMGPILLFLGTIQEFCDEEGEDFAEQVRITYLHELGHHLGFGEDDLEERGLE